MEKSDFIRLKHMLEAAHTCMHFSAGKTRIDFEKNQMLSFAVIRALEILGFAKIYYMQTHQICTKNQNILAITRNSSRSFLVDAIKKLFYSRGSY